MTAYAARHAIPRVPRTPLHRRLAAVLRHPLRGLQIRRWCAALRRDAAALAEDDAWFALQRRQWQLRAYQLRHDLRMRQDVPDGAAPVRPAPGAGLTYTPAMWGRRPSVRISRKPAATITDMTVVVRRPETDTTPVGAITGPPRWLRDTPADGIAVTVGPYEYREGQ